MALALVPLGIGFPMTHLVLYCCVSNYFSTLRSLLNTLILQRKVSTCNLPMAIGFYIQPMLLYSWWSERRKMNGTGKNSPFIHMSNIVDPDLYRISLLLHNKILPPAFYKLLLWGRTALDANAFWIWELKHLPRWYHWLSLHASLPHSSSIVSTLLSATIAAALHFCCQG